VAKSGNRGTGSVLEAAAVSGALLLALMRGGRTSAGAPVGHPGDGRFFGAGSVSDTVGTGEPGGQTRRKLPL
jgi:hypothetical protein